MLLIIIWTHHLNYFFSLVLASNNPPLKIYCENIIIAFLNFNFLLFILFFSLSLFLASTRLFIFFFLFFFSSTHVFFIFSLSSLLTFLYAFHLHQTTICLISLFYFFLFFYFAPHIQPHSPHPRTSSPWSSLFFSFSLNLTTHSPHPRTSSPWSSHVISLNFTKNLQYLSLFVTPKPNGNWSQIDASELLLITQPQPCRKIQIGLLRVRLAIEVSTYYSYYFLCLSFQFSVYFVVSEIRVIWVISYISNWNIDQKHFLRLQKLLKSVHPFWLNFLHFKIQLFL